MTPSPAATIVETAVIESPAESIHLRTTTRIHEKSRINKHEQIRDPYDETLPKNDPKFFAPVRNWEKSMGFVTALRWTNIISIALFHLYAVVAFFLSITQFYPKWQTVLFGVFMGMMAGFGVTAGAHRYWCHRSYKAKLPLQIILMICYSVAGQNSIFNWVRDHRVHHKFSESPADPHDVNRGFFFSHIGWLMMKKHPAVISEGNKIDMSDIVNDPLVRFHNKYFNVFKTLCCFVIPTVVPTLWGESWWFSILSQSLLRYMFSLHFTWSVNSFAHIWGNHPYDRHIKPAENWGVSLVAMGEGWHNYHHSFPWDYKAAELGYLLNFTTLLLDTFASIGWAYDLKQASPTLVQAVARNRGERDHKDFQRI